MPEATIILVFTTSFLIAFSGAVMPGPLLALTIRESARHGFWAGPLLVLGHGILELSLVLAIVLGLVQFIEGDLTASVIGIGGGTVLIVMGLTTIRQGRQNPTLTLAGPASTPQNRNWIVSGILGSASNPYWFIWWIAVGTTYLLWSLELGAFGVASFFSGHILADLAWYTLISFIIAKGRKAINDAVYRWLLLVCGFALIALGGYFNLSGIRFLID